MDPFDLAADLDAFAAETPELPETAGAEPDLPDGLDELRDLANKLLRKHHRLEGDEKALIAVAEAEFERIQRWLEDRRSGIERERERVTSLLDRLMRSYREATNGKTLKLPNGELRLRPPKERIVVDDAQAFVAWAVASKRDDLLRVKREPDKREIADGMREPHAPDDPPLRFARELSAEPLPGLKRWRLYDTTAGDALPGIVVETDEQPTFSLSTARTEELAQ